MSKNLWTELELLEVLKLYCRTPFGRLHRGNPDIITLAVQLGRTPSAIALKAVNFANLDDHVRQAGVISGWSPRLDSSRGGDSW